MARWGKCDFKELKKLEQQMERLEDYQFDAFCEACAKELAARLLAKVKRKTPTGVYPAPYANPVEGYEPNKTGGELKRNWYTGDVIKKGNAFEIEVYNSKLYASYVEYGHRQTPGRFVPQIGKRLKEGWVDGKYMMTLSVMELESQAPRLLEKKLQQFLKECFDGK